MTFNSNGGSEVESQTVSEGSIAKKPTDPTREDCEFEGWYKDSSFLEKWDFKGGSELMECPVA